MPLPNGRSMTLNKRQCRRGTGEKFSKADFEKEYPANCHMYGACMPVNKANNL